MNTRALITLLVALMLGACKPEPKAPSDAITNASRVYTEALDAISKRYLFATDDPAQITQDALNAYLAAHDAYSGRLTRDEYARYRQLDTSGFGGIGMDLERLRNGDTLVFPATLGPAGQAGIRAGEQLVSVDGQAVRGKPLALIATLATGREGTPVNLIVTGADGARRQVRVVRAHIDDPSVSESDVNGLHVVKIAHFSGATKSYVAAALKGLNAGQPLVIDLRGCGGGSFFAALDIAMLFLAKGAPIVTVNTRAGKEPYASTVDTHFAPRPVFVWQDAHTASAAEVLTGALVDNGLARSVGAQSAGKGTRQDIVELADGSALILTTGTLSTPRGFAFDQRGLAPTRTLAPSSDTAAYARATLSSP
jgi:carboxyl-terminal processing protease